MHLIPGYLCSKRRRSCGMRHASLLGVLCGVESVAILPKNRDSQCCAGAQPKSYTLDTIDDYKYSE